MKNFLEAFSSRNLASKLLWSNRNKAIILEIGLSEQTDTAVSILRSKEGWDIRHPAAKLSKELLQTLNFEKFA